MTFAELIIQCVVLAIFGVILAYLAVAVGAALVLVALTIWEWVEGR